MGRPRRTAHPLFANAAVPVLVAFLGHRSRRFAGVLAGLSLGFAAVLLLKVATGGAALAGLTHAVLAIPWLLVNTGSPAPARACGAERAGGEGSMTTLRGTLRRDDLSGGSMILEAEDGRRYLLGGATKTLRQQGLRVEIEGELDPDGVSIVMTGEPVLCVRTSRRL